MPEAVVVHSIHSVLMLDAELYFDMTCACVC